MERQRDDFERKHQLVSGDLELTEDRLADSKDKMDSMEKEYNDAQR